MALVTERQKIQHLLRRAGFGYRADELEMLLILKQTNSNRTYVTEPHYGISA